MPLSTTPLPVEFDATAELQSLEALSVDDAAASIASLSSAVAQKILTVVDSTMIQVADKAEAPGAEERYERLSTIREQLVKRV